MPEEVKIDMEQENKNKKRKSTGLADWLHFIESDLTAREAGRIISFGNGRLTTTKPSDKIEITAEDIRKLSQSNDEIED